MPVEKLTPSFTFTEDRLQALQAVVPEAFADGQVNWETLKEALAPHLEDEGPGTEHFGLFWPGKRQARRLAKQPSKGTLRPVKGQGVNEDATSNLFIEGDNLEVLKLLQKSYAGRVKLIYIDPPYNTGNDFVYKDDFAEPLEEYLQRTGQADAEGLLTTNPKAGGRFHSNWLNMMLPRLMLAKKLLSDDGVIFCSIDDNEVANFINMCNEFFGEENKLGIFCWYKKRKGSFLSKKIVSVTEYVVCYANKIEELYLFGGEADSSESQPLVKRTNSTGVLTFPCGIIKTKLKDGIYKRGIYGNGSSSVELLEDVSVENGVITNELIIKGPFVWSQGFLDKQISEGAILIINTTNFQIRVFKVQGEDSHKGMLSFIDGVSISGTNEDGYEELKEIFGEEKIIDYPKPKNLIKTLINSGTHFDKYAIVIDFFAGSSTTAQAVLELNREDGGNRKFIMVQLPESTPKDSAARQAGYHTIADIGKERIRRVIAKLQKQPVLDRDPPEDLGFAVYRLDRSHFKAWQDYDGPPNPAAIDDLFSRFEDPLTLGWQPHTLLDEVLLLQGFPLDSRRTRLKDFPHNALVQVDCEWFSYRLFVCLDATLNPATIAQLPLNLDDKFIGLDSALTDQTKQQLADRCTLVVL